ncbi:MAG: hypothetical protein V3W18_05225 [candidate division Zixibacteria bacterium]
MKPPSKLEIWLFKSGKIKFLALYTIAIAFIILATKFSIYLFDHSPIDRFVNKILDVDFVAFLIGMLLGGLITGFKRWSKIKKKVAAANNLGRE